MVKKWEKVGQSPLSFELSQDYNLTMENRLPKKNGVTLKMEPFHCEKGRFVQTNGLMYKRKKVSRKKKPRKQKEQSWKDVVGPAKKGGGCRRIFV